MLQQALAACRVHGATLVIAKLDRLARDAHFLLGLQKAGVSFRAADMPEANEMVVGIMAVVAQAERKLISERTKVALAAAKRRGVSLGGRPENLKRRRQGALRSAQVRAQHATARASDLRDILTEIRSTGVTSASGIARELNQRQIPAPRGGSWQATQVSRLLNRVEEARS